MMFPTPQIAQALSEKSKDKLRATLDIESEESRKHDFIARANELVVEMHALHRLAQYRVFRRPPLFIRFVVFSFSVREHYHFGEHGRTPRRTSVRQGMTRRAELALHEESAAAHVFGYLIVAIYHPLQTSTLCGSASSK